MCAALSREKSSRGIGLVEVVVVSALIAVATTLYVGSLLRQTRQAKAHSEKVLAELYASELLEAFASLQTGAKLKTFLGVNPVSSSLSPYFLCSHINVLDRASNRILNSHPVAEGELRLGNFDVSSKTRANRFFSVQVINIQTLQVEPSFCSYHINSAPALATNQRYLLTVGVSWVPEGERVEQVREVALSHVLAP